MCAYTALFFTILHTAGHLVNFYHISTQPVEHLRCLSKELSFASDAKPDIGYWLFQVNGSLLYCNSSFLMNCLHLGHAYLPSFVVYKSCM